MFWRLLKVVLILPGTALVFIPAVILWLSRDGPHAATAAAPASVRFWCGAPVLGAGLVLAVWTVRLLVSKGQGTPGPWDPPTRFVVAGPYAHVRNPMITGAILILLGEALLLGSWPVAGWALVFFLINTVYFPFVEEPGLERRFGEDYRRYKTHVPRWVPRLTPYRPDDL